MLKKLKSKLKTIFFETHADSQIRTKLRHNRGIMVFAFAIIDLAFISLVDPLPTEAEANSYEGVLIGIFSSSRAMAFKIDTTEGEYTIHTGRGHKFLESLEPFIGKKVIVRAYYHLNVFLFPELTLVQFEVDNIKFVDNWESIRQASKNNPAEIYFIVLALLIIVITTRNITKYLQIPINESKNT